MLATAHPADRQIVQRNLLLLHLLRQDFSGGVELKERRRNEISHHGGEKDGHYAGRGEQGKKAFKRGQQEVCRSHQSDDGAHPRYDGRVSVRKMWPQKLDIYERNKKEK